MQPCNVSSRAIETYTERAPHIVGPKHVRVVSLRMYLIKVRSQSCGPDHATDFTNPSPRTGFDPFIYYALSITIFTVHRLSRFPRSTILLCCV